MNWRQPCTHCGETMALNYTKEILLSNPPQRPTRWICESCGHNEAGPTLTEKTHSMAVGNIHDAQNWFVSAASDSFNWDSTPDA